MLSVLRAFGHPERPRLARTSRNCRAVRKWKERLDVARRADVGRGARPVRVLRCATNEDVTLLVRHARVQEPSVESPLLVCVDDLGRDSFTQWPAARDQLLGVPGVYVLATVRREDFTAQLAGSATVVDPKLTQQSAEAVYDHLKAAGVPLIVEPEEAMVRAEGLLVGFIALATTGERLETVLATQVERLRAEPASAATLPASCDRGAHPRQRIVSRRAGDASDPRRFGCS